MREEVGLDLEPGGLVGIYSYADAPVVIVAYHVNGATWPRGRGGRPRGERDPDFARQEIPWDALAFRKHRRGARGLVPPAGCIERLWRDVQGAPVEESREATGDPERLIVAIGLLLIPTLGVAAPGQRGAEADRAGQGKPRLGAAVLAGRTGRATGMVTATGVVTAMGMATATGMGPGGGGGFAFGVGVGTLLTAPFWAYPRVYAAPAYPVYPYPAYAPYPAYPVYQGYPAYPAYSAYPAGVTPSGFTPARRFGTSLRQDLRHPMCLARWRRPRSPCPQARELPPTPPRGPHHPVLSGVGRRAAARGL